MKKIFAIALMCCALVLTLGLAACGGSSSGSGSGGSGAAAGSEGSSESTPVESTSAETAPASGPIDVPAEYIDSDGGITFAAVLGLTGPELTTLLQQQGYEWDYSHWDNPATEDQLEICSSTSKHVYWGIEREEYEAATGKGDLAKGQASIITHNYDLTDFTTETLEAARDSLAPGMTVQDSKVLAFGAELWSIVTDEAGNRYLLEVGAYDENTLTASLQTDEFLAAADLGSIDEVFY